MDNKTAIFGDVLTELAEELDVPPSKYEEAKRSYGAVGDWLNAEDSNIVRYNPEIYPQGSFALGTAVRPLGDDDYDVDAVCLLQNPPDDVVQQQLKEMIGDRLKAHGTYAKILDPKEGGRRCWTLKYADASKFHLDILPAIPDDYTWLLQHGVPVEFAKHAIQITDRDTWDTEFLWPKSNSRGYAGWFKNQMRVRLEELRKAVAFKKTAKVHDIQDYEVRTPLQQIIQLLKRHRDGHFNGDDDKPISIIITTLAAQAYDNEPDLVKALLKIIPEMRKGILKKDGNFWVGNPVNPEENFADKWEESPRKKELFFDWLDMAESLHSELLSESSEERLEEKLIKSYGQRDASSALKKYANKRTSGSRTLVTGVSPGANIPSRFNVSHREAPRWPVEKVNKVSVTGKYKKNGAWNSFSSDGTPLPKGHDLMFYADTNTPAPFDVYWQIVNTGREASDKGQLRGSILQSKSAGVGGLRQKEATAYTGSHWVECFIVKNGKCVARSGEFVVNIQ